MSTIRNEAVFAFITHMHNRNIGPPKGDRKMKNKILTTLCLWAAIVLLAACGKTITVVPSPSPLPSPVQIRWFIGVGGTLNEDLLRLVRSFTDDFNAKQTNIVLTLDIVPADTANDVLSTEIASGNAPDIVGPFGVCAAYSIYKQWLDLGPYLEGYDLSIFEPEAADILEMGEDGLVGLPLALYPSALYFNTRIFDEAGLYYPPGKYGEKYGMPSGSMADWNWDTLAEIAKLLTVDGGGHNANEPNFNPQDIEQLGFTMPLNETCIKSTVSGEAESLQEYSIPGVDPTSEPFSSGDAAMAYAYSSYKDLLGTMSNWNFGAVPADPDNGKVTTALQVDMISAMKTTRYPMAAVQVIYAIASDPKIIRAWAMVPPESSVQGVPALSSLHAEWLGHMNSTSPGFHWDTLLAGLDYAVGPQKCCWVYP
ncbi:MAG: extracellular solute-binding protein [Anaerolineales bacterium]